MYIYVENKINVFGFYRGKKYTRNGKNKFSWLDVFFTSSLVSILFWFTDIMDSHSHTQALAYIRAHQIEKHTCTPAHMLLPPYIFFCCSTTGTSYKCYCIWCMKCFRSESGGKNAWIRNKEKYRSLYGKGDIYWEKRSCEKGEEKNRICCEWFFTCKGIAAV